jgi:hypothetical protein
VEGLSELRSREAKLAVNSLLRILPYSLSFREGLLKDEKYEASSP